MRQNNLQDGTQAAIIITPQVFDKRALYTTDLVPLSISMSNLNHLSLCYPARLACLLQQNGTMELLIKRLRQIALNNEFRSQLTFSNGLACLCNLACTGGARIRFRLVQANVIPLLLVPLQKACTILNSISDTWETKKYFLRKPRQQSHLQTIDQMEDRSVHVRPMTSAMETETSFLCLQTHSEHPKVTVHDLLMVCTLIAYISKYEPTRAVLHDHHPLFQYVEQLTTPTIIPDVRKWATTCMRNAVRSSDSSLFKRCGNMSCQVKKVCNPTITCSRCSAVYYCR
jgi:hypothetical protein